MRLIISGLSEINFKLMGFKLKPSFSKLFELIFIHYPKYIVYCTPVVYSLGQKRGIHHNSTVNNVVRKMEPESLCSMTNKMLIGLHLSWRALKSLFMMS